MGSTRVHVVMDAEEHARYRSQAEREGQSLSEWLRGAARDRLERAARSPLPDVAALDRFFASCDERDDEGREPDWDEHLRVIDRSRRDRA